MNIIEKFTKWTEKKFSPYEEIKINSDDLEKIKRFNHWREIFKRLNSITEYRLAMQLAKWNITKEQFDWAMEYWKYLIQYFN